jgi:hypothetical protein
LHVFRLWGLWMDSCEVDCNDVCLCVNVAWMKLSWANYDLFTCDESARTCVYQ